MRAVDLNQRLARNLQRLRRESGLSQEALAAACGLHRTYVGGIERGERRVTLRTVEKLAVALQVDPLDLLKGASAP
jgi:transcriptional regulator with XRE-family HTH domain